jgi:hypothetical protein
MPDVKTLYSLSYLRGGRRERLELAVDVEPASLLLYADTPGIGRVWGLSPDAVIDHTVALLMDEGATDVEVHKHGSLHHA